VILFAIELTISASDGFIEPDKTVMALENRLVGQQAKGAETTIGRVLPRRPAFGTQGRQVILWANYFTITASANTSLLKYTLKVEKVSKESGDKKGNKPEGTKKPENKEPKGKKLHTIIKSALEQIAKSVPYATEFKDQVITRQKLPFESEQTVKVSYTVENRHDEYNVKFDGPTTVDLPRLLRYMRDGQDPTADASYPKFPVEIDALSIITGHFARSAPDSAALGRSRYFPLHIEGETFELGHPEYNRIVRGYFQSARLATGRLLLNTNVSHGVFRPHGKVSALCEKFHGDYWSLHRSLTNLRARVEILSEDKDPKKIRIVEKAITGLAEPIRRGRGKGEDQNKLPIVKELGAKAKDVQFYIRAPAPAGVKPNAYCSVEEYYQKSK
jgi:eukaryotic translation initiation factor 2C